MSKRLLTDNEIQEAIRRVSGKISSAPLEDTIAKDQDTKTLKWVIEDLRSRANKEKLTSPNGIDVPNIFYIKVANEYEQQLEVLE